MLEYPAGRSALLCSRTCSSVLPVPQSVQWCPHCLLSLAPASLLGLQSLVISCTMSAVSGNFCTMSAVSGHLLYCVRSLWSSPVLCPQSLVISVLCPQSLVISCTVSAVSGHLLYYVRSLWSSPVLCPQVSGQFPVLCPQVSGNFCTMSAVSGHLRCLCSMSAVSGHPLYYAHSLWSSPVLCPQSLVIS
ncbi:unnamed protein product, partial [Staurois parvus]